MFENIIFAVMVIIAAAAGIWVWWLEKHGTKTEQNSVSTKEERNF